MLQEELSRQQRWHKRNEEKQRLYRREYNIKKRYDITAEEYDKLFSASPVCELCGIRESKHLDHNHKTGKIRGVLCNQCNRGLGMLGDTIESIEDALDYLKERD